MVLICLCRIGLLFLAGWRELIVLFLTPFYSSPCRILRVILREVLGSVQFVLCASTWTELRVGLLRALVCLFLRVALLALSLRMLFLTS